MTLTEKFQAAHAGLAVGPLRPRTLLHAGGPDARDFLHRMLTQDVRGLPPGGAAHFALLTVKGHLVGEGQLLLRPDGVLLDVDPAAAPALRAQLEKMVIMDDVTITDQTEAWRVLAAARSGRPGRRRRPRRRPVTVGEQAARLSRPRPAGAGRTCRGRAGRAGVGWRGVARRGGPRGAARSTAAWRAGGPTWTARGCPWRPGSPPTPSASPRAATSGRRWWCAPPRAARSSGGWCCSALPAGAGPGSRSQRRRSRGRRRHQRRGDAGRAARPRLPAPRPLARRGRGSPPTAGEAEVSPGGGRRARLAALVTSSERAEGDGAVGSTASPPVDDLDDLPSWPITTLDRLA